MNPLAIFSAIGTALGIGNLLSTSGKRKKRERAQVRAIQEQFLDVEGRIPEIEEFYDELTGFAEQGAEISKKGASQDFISQAFQLGEAEREGVRRSGMAQTSTQGLEVQRELQGREYSNVLDLLEQNRQGELLRIGKARETELQGIEDALFGLETEALARGGGVFSSEEEFFQHGLDQFEKIKNKQHQGFLGSFLNNLFGLG